MKSKAAPPTSPVFNPNHCEKADHRVKGERVAIIGTNIIARRLADKFCTIGALVTIIAPHSLDKAKRIKKDLDARHATTLKTIRRWEFNLVVNCIPRRGKNPRSPVPENSFKKVQAVVEGNPNNPQSEFLRLGKSSKCAVLEMHLHAFRKKT